MTNSKNQNSQPNIDTWAPFSISITSNTQSSTFPAMTPLTTPLNYHAPTSNSTTPISTESTDLTQPISTSTPSHNSRINTSQPSTSAPPKQNTRRHPRPNPKYHNSDYHLYTLSLNPPTEPPTITHALKHPSWRATMNLNLMHSCNIPKVEPYN